MFTSKNVLRKLNSIINTIKESVNNQEVLGYILTSLELANNKSSVVSIKGDNSVLIVDHRRDEAFYLELSPSLDVIDKVYTRFTRAAGDFDERVTVSFDDNKTNIHQYSSLITKDKGDERVTSLTDTFRDETFIDNILRYRKSFQTEVAYPLRSNAEAASSLEEVVINSEGTAAFKKIVISSAIGEKIKYGLFSAKDNDFTSTSSIDKLTCVQTVTEDEYNEFTSNRDKKITKDLK